MTKEDAIDIYLKTPVRPGNQPTAFKKAQALLTQLGETQVLAQRVYSKSSRAPFRKRIAAAVKATAAEPLIDSTQPGMPRQAPKLRRLAAKPKAAPPAAQLNFCPCCGVGLSAYQAAHEIAMREVHAPA